MCRNLLLVAVLSVAFGCTPDGEVPFDPVTQTPEVSGPAARNLEVTVPSAGVRLPGYLMLAAGEGSHPTVLLLHGYPGNEKNLDLAQSLRRAGMNVLFIHYRGAWGAEGEFRFANTFADGRAALEYLRANAGQYPIDADQLIVIGHSMGGFAALQTAAADADVACAVGIAAANIGTYAARGDAAKAGFAAYTDNLFMLAGMDGATAVAELVANAEAFDLRNLGPQLEGRPVLLITGTGDTVVPVDMQRRLAASWQEDGPVLTTREIAGDHAFAADRLLLQREVIEWLQQDCL
ncbi:MAG: alpha/beta fold hydrolase [Pseudomonadota bacterium]